MLGTPAAPTVVHARMRLEGQTPNGGTAGIRQNLFIFVVQQREDHWLCVSAQNTDIVIGAETHIRDESGKLKPADYRIWRNDAAGI